MIAYSDLLNRGKLNSPFGMDVTFLEKPIQALFFEGTREELDMLRNMLINTRQLIKDINEMD